MKYLYITLLMLFLLIPSIALSGQGGPTGGGGGSSSCSGDINVACSQVTATHLASALPANQGGTGNALQYVVQDLGSTTTPACNFNNGYICRFTSSAASTLSVSNTPGSATAPATIEIDWYLSGAATNLTLPATFFIPTPNNQVNTTWPGGDLLQCNQHASTSTFCKDVFVCDGTNCFLQSSTNNGNFDLATVTRLTIRNGGSINSQGAVTIDGGSGALTVSAGTASAVALTSGSVLSTTGGTAPTLTAGCNGAGSSVSAASTDNRGQFTSQTSAVTTCTLTFNHTWPQAPFCVATDANASATPVAISIGAISTTTVVFDFVSKANNVINYMCM